MEASAEFAAWAETTRWRHLAVEAAGVFWIAAELFILALVCWGREHLAASPGRAKLRLSAQARWRFRAAAGVTLVLAIFVARRVFVVIEPNAEAIVRDELAHLAVWALFVTAWVGLEAAIVYHGYRGYRLLGGLLPRGAVVVPLTVGLLATAHAAPGNIDAVLEPWRNAMYLYLRVAGVFWIALEWVAAVLLWRSFLLLRVAAMASRNP